MQIRIPPLLNFLFLVLLFLPVSPLQAGTQQKPYRFYHEKCSHPRLKLLKSRSGYAGIIARESGEFAKMTALKSWVYEKLPYSFTPPFPAERNSLKILKLARGNATFLCSSYAALYMQAAQSLGWNVRYYFLRRPNGLQHAAVEVWSNRYRKWVYMDPTWNIHVELKGMPCALIEIRKHWLRNEGRDLDYVYGSGRKRTVYRYSDFPVRRNDSVLWKRFPLGKGWLSYTFEIAMVGRNNFFSHRDGSGRNIWDLIYIYRDSRNRHDRRWPFRRRRPLSRSQFLFPLNTPEIRVKESGNGKVTVDLFHRSRKSFTPNFSHFERLINGKWQRCPANFTVEKDIFVKSTRVRVVNKCGVPGPAVTPRHD